MVLVQKWPFFQFFFLGNIGKENVFYDIQEPKNAFLGYKNNKSKKSKNWHFSKGVNPWFWSKNGLFFNFFFVSNILQENVFYHILERKNVFLSYKNKKSKKPKNSNWFWSKNDDFSNFFFKQYRRWKCLLWYSRTKNVFLSYKNKTSKKWKNSNWFWSKNYHFCNFFF